MLQGAIHKPMENEQDTTLNSINELLERIRESMPTDYNYAARTVVDQHCMGLRFVASSVGRKGFWVRRFKNKAGKMKQYTFAEYPATSITDARNYVEQVRGQDAPIIKRPYGEHTIAHMVDVYLEEYVKTQRCDQAYRNAKSALMRNLKPIMARPLDQVDAHLLHEIILTVKKRTPTMAHLLRTELKQAWSYALATGMTSIICPITSMTGGRFKKIARDRILSDEETGTLLNGLDQYSPILADVIVVCLYTGLRSGEVAQIHTDWLDTESTGEIWLTIPAEYMKNDMPHRVPIFGRVEKIINRRWPETLRGYLFPTFRDPQKPIQQATLAREVHRIHGGEWRLHDLRRTTRTNLQRIGCPFEISETILAHKLPGVSSVYARYQYTAEKIHWLQKLADYYMRMEK